MKAVEVKRLIAEVDAKLEVLEPWLQTLQDIRDAYLLRPEGDARARRALEKIERGWRHDEGVPRELVGAPTQRGLPALRQEIDRLKDKRRLLEAELPSKQELKKAEHEAASHLKAMREAEAELRKCWSTYVRKLAAAEAAGREVVSARGEAWRHGCKAQELAENFGVELDGIPLPHWRGPQLAPEETQLAALLGASLRTVLEAREVDGALFAQIEKAQRKGEQEAA